MNQNSFEIQNHYPRFLVMTLLFAMCFCFMISCGSLSSMISKENSSKGHKIESEDKLLNYYETLAKTKNFIKLNDEITETLKRDPLPARWYSIMFYYGMAKEGIEDWNGAIEVYQQIIDRSVNREMEFVALAFYRRAYCYEVILENEKALASLSDAARLEAYLPLEVSLAEIPARIASLHARFGQTALSDQYIIRAERGILKLKALKKNSDPEVISKALVKMGSLSLTQIDEDTYRQNILTMTRNQRFLVQAIELKHPVWSQEAQKLLLSNYTNLWSFIQNFKVNPTSDWEVDRVSESNKKAEFLSLYLEALENLKNYEAPMESPEFKQTLVVYSQIKNIEAQALTLLTEVVLKKPWNNNSSLSGDRFPSSFSGEQEISPLNPNKKWNSNNDIPLPPEEEKNSKNNLIKTLPKKKIR